MERKRNGWKVYDGLFGVIVSVTLLGAAICVAGIVIISILIGEQTIKPEAAGYGLVATLLVSSFAAARVVMKKRAGNDMLSALISTAIMLCLLILGNLITGAGNMDGIGQTLLVIIGGSFCALVMKAQPRRKKKYLGRKY